MSAGTQPPGTTGAEAWAQAGSPFTHASLQPAFGQRRASRQGLAGLSAIFRRELTSLFLQPLAWILLALSLGLSGFIFSTYLVRSGGDLSTSLGLTLGQGTLFWALLAMLPPLLTMRMLAEEARSGVLEFLLTAPVSDAAVVLGKMLAAVGFFALLWASGPLYGIALAWQGAEVDFARLGLMYLGALLLSALFCAIGLFASSLTSTPALGAFLAFLITLLFLVAPGLIGRLTWLDPDIARELSLKVDVIGRFDRSFHSGVLDSGHVVFFLVWIAVFLFLAVRRLEMQRWA